MISYKNVNYFLWNLLLRSDIITTIKESKNDLISHFTPKCGPGIKVPVTVVSGNVDFQFAGIDGLCRTD